MATLDFSKITPDNGAVRDVAELLFLQFFSEPNALEKFLIFHTGVHTGQKLVGIGRFGPMGKKVDSHCNPTYGKSMISTQQKEWEIGDWAIDEQVCADDLRETLFKYLLKSGTDIDDLQSSDFMDAILVPQLQDAIQQLMWRIVWFGDKNATNITIGENKAITGTITSGIDPSYFTICDGLFKHLIAIATANPAQHVSIEANTVKVFNEQYDALYEPGVATGIVDQMIRKTSPALRQSKNKGILLTQSIADALSTDITKNNQGSELQWQSIFEGVEVVKYKGWDIYAINIWDEMLQSFFRVKGEGIDYVINPHRAVATSFENFRAATSSTATLAEVESWYEKKDKVNYMTATDTIGTLVWQDDLCVVAY